MKHDKLLNNPQDLVGLTVARVFENLSYGQRIGILTTCGKALVLKTDFYGKPSVSVPFPDEVGEEDLFIMGLVPGKAMHP